MWSIVPMNMHRERYRGKQMDEKGEEGGPKKNNKD